VLTALARAHVRGVAVDWAAILPGGQRVDLPTYAFRRQRYWPQPSRALVPAGGDGSGSAAEARFWAAVEGGDVQALSQTLAVDGRQSLEQVLPALVSWRRRERDQSVTGSWRYRVSWVPVADPGPAVLSGTWLVVVPAGSAGGDLASEYVQVLAARDAHVVVVEAAAADDRDVLADRIRAVLPAAGMQGVLSLLGLADTPVPGFPVVSQGLAGTLALVQALGDAGVTAPLWVLTCGAVVAGPGDRMASPIQAQVWGLGRVAALEHPDRWGGLVDVPPVLDERAASRLCAVLAGCGEDQVAIRSAGILGRRLVRARPPRSDGRWVPRGSVLVTGGTGAIAGHVARWLAGHGAPRVVLASRSGPAAPGVAALAMHLAACGTTVDVIGCDVAVRAEVAGLLARIGAAGPPLTAVMHTAGVLDDGVLDRLDAARLALVLAAKAVGAAHLDELTVGLDLDAFVLFSSAAAALGGAGQGNYAAANAFLDALAECRRGQGLAAVSVAWGPWAGGGLAQANEAVRRRVRRGVLPDMDPALAVKALGQVLEGGDGGALAVMDVDWAQFASTPGAAGMPLVRDLPEVRQVAHGQDAGAGPGRNDLARQLAGLPRAEQARRLTELVRAEAAAVLGHSSPETVEAGRAFSEFGFDSLTGVELRNRLTAATGLRLSATLLFDYPTPAVLADFLRAKAFNQEQDRLPVIEELDRLGSVLSSVAWNRDDKLQIAAHLEAIMREFSGGSADDMASGHELEEATDDEMFDLVERELGLTELD
jgi:short-subunit dehydrogenase